MMIHIHIDSMKAAERLSAICKEYTKELFLRSEKFCVDPKSTLGILAMMYSSRERIFLDTCGMEDREIPLFLQKISDYLVSEQAQSAV